MNRRSPSFAIIPPTVAAVFLSCAVGRAQEIRPSFDCRRASFPDERAICADPRLAQLDQAVNIALGQMKKDMVKSAREAAADRLKDRHGCGTNRMCILDNQVQLLADFDGMGASVAQPPWVGTYRLALIDGGAAAMVQGLPKRVGACTRTKISGLGTRFGETLKPPSDPSDDHGTSIDYANGGHGVTYSYEPSVGDAAIGDDVALCLVSVPKGCPPGDDRGKMYSATDLRTKGSWILPDAQHMCGGA